MTESTRVQSGPQEDILDAIFRPEVKEFMATTIEVIPKMTVLLKVMSNLYDMAEHMLNDGGPLEYSKLAISERADPIQDKIEDGISLIEEARDRAEDDTSKVGMIGLYKMLKDPTVQKIFDL